MPTIECQNIIRRKDGSLHKCGRFLGSISPTVVDFISLGGGDITLRCPSCNNAGRFAIIESDNYGGLQFRATSETKVISSKVKFNTVLNAEQVG